MNFELTKEQQMIREMVSDFAEKEIKPYARELDQKAEFPYETFKKMGELGLLGIPFPEKYGGSGGDTISYCIAVEEIGKACGGQVSVMPPLSALVLVPSIISVRRNRRNNGSFQWQKGKHWALSV